MNSTMLAEQLGWLQQFLPQGMTVDDWLTGDGPDMQSIAQEHREDVWFLYGYLRGMADAEGLTVEQLREALLSEKRPCPNCKLIACRRCLLHVHGCWHCDVCHIVRDELK